MPARDYGVIRLSPDDSRLALDVRGGASNSIWIWDFKRELLTRLSLDQVSEDNPVWTADGRHVVFHSTHDGLAGLFRRSADGSGVPERLATASYNPKSVTSDGKQILATEIIRPGVLHLKMLPLDRKTTQGETLIATDHQNNNPDVSPDGRWLAYQSNESGTIEVYVRPFPNVNNARWQVSNGGGVMPQWSRTGRELFFLNSERVLSSVEFEDDRPSSPARRSQF